MKITNPELKVVRFDNEDVIATSIGPLTGTSGMFFIPSSQYGDGSLAGNYVYFNGKLGDYSDGSYTITDISGAYGNADSDRNFFIPPAGYFENEGVTLKPEDMYLIQLWGSKTYDAFSYGNGQYYTSGVSYYENYFQ